MHLRLIRMPSTSQGTAGVLLGPGQERLMFTFEDSDLGNRRNVSRIPAGTYFLKRTLYHKYGYPTYEVTGVSGRSRILFHPGNTEEDTAGCILPGEYLGVFHRKDEETGKLQWKLGVANSRNAFTKLMQLLTTADGDPVLEIIDQE